MGLHVFPIPIPPPISLSTRSLDVHRSTVYHSQDMEVPQYILTVNYLLKIKSLIFTYSYYLEYFLKALLRAFCLLIPKSHSFK